MCVSVRERESRLCIQVQGLGGFGLASLTSVHDMNLGVLLARCPFLGSGLPLK